jgi:hypothetical protein
MCYQQDVLVVNMHVNDAIAGREIRGVHFRPAMREEHADQLQRFIMYRRDLAANTNYLCNLDCAAWATEFNRSEPTLQQLTPVHYSALAAKVVCD